MSIDVDSDEARKLRAELVAQRRQRYWLALAVTGIVSGTLALTLGGIPWLGAAALALGFVGVVAARPDARG